MAARKGKGRRGKLTWDDVPDWVREAPCEHPVGDPYAEECEQVHARKRPDDSIEMINYDKWIIWRRRRGVWLIENAPDLVPQQYRRHWRRVAREEA